MSGKTTSGLCSIFWLLLVSVVAGALPFILSGANPGSELPALMEGADPMLQAAILQHSLQQTPWPWAAEAWAAPWMYPSQWSLATMEPLLGQALPFKLWPGAMPSAAGAYSLALFGQLAAGAAAAFLLLKRLGARSVFAAAGALVWTAGPYAVGHWHHLNQLPGPWIPLALLALLALREAKSWASPLLFVALIGQLLSGLYGMAALGALLFVALPFFVGGQSRRSAIPLATVLLLVAVAVQVWSLPWKAAAAEGIQRSVGEDGSFAARWGDFNNMARTWGSPWVDPANGRPALYPGLGLLLLAPIGLRNLWSRENTPGVRPLVLTFLLGGVLLLILSFGRSLPLPLLGEVAMPFAWLQDHFWPLQALRAPSRFWLPISLILATFACFGAQTLWLMTRGRTRFALAVVLALVVADLAPSALASVRIAPSMEEEAIVAVLKGGEGAWALLPMPCHEREEIPLQARAMLWAQAAGRPLAGGSSGNVPPLVQRLRLTCCGEIEDTCLGILRRSGIRSVLIPASDIQLPGRTLFVGPNWRLLELINEFPEED